MGVLNERYASIETDWLRSLHAQDHTVTAVIWEVTDEAEVSVASALLAETFPSATSAESPTIMRYEPPTITRYEIGETRLALARSTTDYTSLPTFLAALGEVHSHLWVVYQTSRQYEYPHRNPPRIFPPGCDQPASLILSHGWMHRYFGREIEPAFFDTFYATHPLGDDGLKFRAAHPETEIPFTWLPEAYISQFLSDHGIRLGTIRLTDSRWTALAHDSLILCRFPEMPGLSCLHLSHQRNEPGNVVVAVDRCGNVIVFATPLSAGPWDSPSSLWMRVWSGDNSLVNSARPIDRGLCVGPGGSLLQLQPPVRVSAARLHGLDDVEWRPISSIALRRSAATL